MSDYLWKEGDELDPTGMDTTANFDDGSPGDKGTAEYVTSGAVADPTNQITGMIVFDGPVSLTAFTVTYGSLLPSGGTNIASHLNEVSVEYWDGSAWNVRGTDSTATLGSSGTGAASFSTYSASDPGDFTAVTAYRLRAYVTGAIVMVVHGTPIILSTGISDFRATFEPACNPPETPILTGSIGLSPTRNILTIN